MSNKSKLDELFVDIPPSRSRKFINGALKLVDNAVASAKLSDSLRDMSSVSIDSLILQSESWIHSAR